MQFPIGCHDFGKIIKKGYTFVDKTLFIKAILQDSSEVILITRPRRFGKTLNMSLLHYFFAESVDGYLTKGMFDPFQIATETTCMAHQGQYPVISLSFKDIKAECYENFYQKFCQILSELYLQHKVVLSSPKLEEIEKQDFRAVMNKQADETTLEFALKQLTRYLYRYYGIKPIVLIDEYDTPLQSAYYHQYYEPVLNLIRGFLSAGLKDNSALEKGVLTGILRVAKEGMFSGLNNIAVYSLLHPRYSEYFGFTEAEVQPLLHQAGLADAAADVRAWYNGYQIGTSRVYNPWSIINYLHNQGAYAAYWLHSSDNLWLQRLVMQASLKIKTHLQALMQGKAIHVMIPDNFVFAQLGHDDATLWSFLIMSGYLTVSKLQRPQLNQLDCQLEIPNREIQEVYVDMIQAWLSPTQNGAWFTGVMEHLLQGQITLWAQDMQQMILQIASFHDLGLQPEAFYHGFLLGCLAYLHQTNYGSVLSNRESGHGRYDIALVPHDPAELAIILELKQVNTSSAAKRQFQLLAAARNALTQIDIQCYDAALRQVGIQRICKIGVAFSGKHLEIQHEIEHHSVA